MKLRVILLLAFGSALSYTFAQELKWRTGLDFYFDNAEYARSSLTKDYTVAGVHLSPQLGVKWDSHHSIYGGVDLMTLSGSPQVIDQANLLAYYQYESKKHSFYAGAFPRGDLFSNYSELLFQDSVNFFRPVIQGLYYQYGSKKGFVNVWLDWNGLRSADQRETFFIGASGYKGWKLFFAEFQMYMFHFANTLPSRPDYGVCDNFQGQFSVGIDLTRKVPLDKLLFSAGALVGYERDRSLGGDPYVPVGAVVRGEVIYKIAGLDIMYYGGNPRMKYYDEYATGLYWGTPFLRANQYAQAKIFLNVIRNRFVNAQLALKVHYSENKFFFEQQFTLSAALDDGFRKKK